MIDNARRLAIEWARALLDMPTDTWVILDTETTGLDGSDQVVQIAIIDGAGNVLIDNELIRPTCGMSFEAEMVHGLSLESLKEAPALGDIFPRLFAALYQKNVVIYNADFDTRLLNQTTRVQMGRDSFFESSTPIYCAMKKYSEFVGEWNPKFRNYRWQRLPVGTHDALGDCRAVLGIIKTMAAARE